MPPRRQTPCELVQGRDRIGNGAERETDGDGVEEGSGQRQLLGIHLGEADGRAEIACPVRRLREHPAREIDAGGVGDRAGVVRKVEPAADRHLQSLAAEFGAKRTAEIAEEEPLAETDGFVVGRRSAVVGGAELGEVHRRNHLRGANVRRGAWGRVRISPRSASWPGLATDRASGKTTDVGGRRHEHVLSSRPTERTRRGL